MWLHRTAPDFEGRLQWADFAADGPQQSIVVCSFNPFQKLAYEAAYYDSSIQLQVKNMVETCWNHHQDIIRVQTVE